MKSILNRCHQQKIITAEQFAADKLRREQEIAAKKNTIGRGSNVQQLGGKPPEEDLLMQAAYVPMKQKEIMEG